MHHHPPNQERAVNLSILPVSGPEQRDRILKIEPPSTDTRPAPERFTDDMLRRRVSCTAVRCTDSAAHKCNYELLTATILVYAIELELPRLLAPDLPSNCSSLKYLKCTHSDYEAS
ncbi:hypothetical protein EVAR_89993_1 [Eumeta japonica]|uniref:Uncharacterized protein n=1 Tax=Eumeta variegata TaxID=151549 RepID=A0A4C2A9A1_EUMVA|nr:hypothetical protein EVAR_89993_1 [Eumeta japonica]